MTDKERKEIAAFAYLGFRVFKEMMDCVGYDLNKAALAYLELSEDPPAEPLPWWARRRP